VLRRISDGGALLHMGFFIEDSTRLDAIIELLPEAQLGAIIMAAADDAQDLWPEAIALMTQVSPRWQTHLANLALGGADATIASMIRGVVAHGLWDATLPLLPALSDANRQRLVDLPVVDDDAVLQPLIQAARDNDLWHYLLPLLPLMGAPLRERVAALAARLDDAALGPLIDAVYRHRLWTAAISLIDALPALRRSRLMLLLADSDPAVLDGMVDTLAGGEEWRQLLPLVTEAGPLADRLLYHLEAMPAARRAPLLARVGELPADTRHFLRARSQALGLSLDFGDAPA